MTMVEERLHALECGLQAAVDELAIIRLVASYGPLVDGGSTELAPVLFASDGVYDVSYGRMSGPEAFANLLRSEDHQQALSGGIAHVMGLPWVRLAGDQATAINCTQIYLRDSEGFRVFRIAQNVWQLARIDGEWKILERVNRLIGDDGEARQLIDAAI